MRFRDLPRFGLIKKPLNRKIYDFFWWPFKILLNFFSGFIKSLKAGMMLAIACCIILTIFMLFMGALTLKVAGGLGIIFMVAGLILSLLMGIVRAFH